MAADRARPTTRQRLAVRPARREDGEAIRGIYNEAVRTTTATFDTKPRPRAGQTVWLVHHDARHPVLVAVLEGRVVGWASLSPWSERRAYDGTAEISVYVGATWQNRGVGRLLITTILREGSRIGLHTVLARIAEGNPVSRRLHLSAGFSPVGVMHEVGYKFGRFLDVELMERSLGPAQDHARRGLEPTRPLPAVRRGGRLYRRR
jgi:L-amino acid N-acyltransferase